jgi:tetratricopeptide (TPR) repeat protein
MVDTADRITILDFGLARRGGDERMTQVGFALGTPAYMAPEQARGLDVDERADLWAFGMVLFEMLAGRLPEAGMDSPSKYHPGLPAELDQIVAKALAPRPADRWTTAREMRLALENCERAMQYSSDSPTRTTRVSVPPPKRLWARMPFAVGVIAALLALVAWWVYEHRDAPQPPLAQGAPKQLHRVAILPVIADNDAQRAIGDGLLELLSDAVGDAERAGQPIWAVPVAEVRNRKLTSPDEARRVYGVDLALESHATPDGTRIRLTLDVINTASLKRISQDSFLYDPAQPLPSRELALERMRKLLALNPVPPTIKTAAAPSGDAYAAYLEGRGLMARYDRAGQLDLAIQRFAQAVQTDPNFAIAHACLAEAYWTKAARMNADPVLTSQALDHARRAVTLDPSVPLTHTKLGRILAETGQHEAAIAELQRALELAPGNADASRELAEVLANQGKFAEAEKLYLQSIHDRPTDWLGHLRLAFFYEDRARLAESEKQLREAGTYAPQNETVARNLGRLHRMQGRYGEAVEEFLRAVKLQPSARSYNALGVTYYFMHDYRKAVVAFETAIELDGAAHQYWGNLGAASALSADDRGKSIPSLRKAADLAESRLRVTPKLYTVLADLAEYRARLGDAKSSLAAIDRIPEAARGPFGGRIVVSYELSGRRADALRALRAYFTSSLTLREILDEPALTNLRGDPAFTAAAEEIRAKSPAR